MRGMELGELVRAERLRRNLSVRAASTLGGISNTWWARFEDGKQPATGALIEAVARAFGWPDTWAAVNPPDEVAALRKQVAELSDRLEGLQQIVAGLLDDATEQAATASPPPARPGAQGS